VLVERIERFPNGKGDYKWAESAPSPKPYEWPSLKLCLAVAVRVRSTFELSIDEEACYEALAGADAQHLYRGHVCNTTIRSKLPSSSERVAGDLSFATIRERVGISARRRSGGGW
jgi:hypothetical protein